MAGIRVHTQTDKDIRDTDTVTKDTEIEYRQTCWQMTQQYGTKQELYEKKKNKKTPQKNFLTYFYLWESYWNLSEPNKNHY